MMWFERAMLLHQQRQREKELPAGYMVWELELGRARLPKPRGPDMGSVVTDTEDPATDPVEEEAD